MLYSGSYAYFSYNAKWQYFNVKEVRNLRLKHFESYSSFSYCMHSSVYLVFWPSGRVVACNILILFRQSTTGPEHPIYRTIRAVRTAWITFKMLCPQISNFVHIKGLVFCIRIHQNINFVAFLCDLFHRYYIDVTLIFYILYIIVR